MKIIFAGKFEIALIRRVDEVVQPDRNASTHEYYAALNRKVTNNYFDRCGTFLVLAEETLVPVVDWNYPYGKQYRGALSDVELGIEKTEAGGGEWDKETTAFVERILKERVLSANSLAYISVLNLTHYTEEKRNHIEKHLKKYQSAAARHYLCRLFLQLRSARETDSFVVLSEEDIGVIQEIGAWIVSGRVHAPFDIPDLSGKLIEPETFVSGLLNFSPPDLHAVSAVRSDKQIRGYAEKVTSLLEGVPSADRERKMLAAMVEAHQKTVAGERAEKIFEILSWLAKPLHYVPGVDAALSIAEDLTDVGKKVLEREVSNKEWQLIAVRMTDIAIRDYLERKGNLLGPTS
jgi:hypothetical protein